MRERAGLPVVALIGYTNAGKSTLFNALTQAGAVAEDKLFATLDPLTRRIELPGRHEILLSDTVGFIAKLPTSLVAAFRATLEELAIGRPAAARGRRQLAARDRAGRDRERGAAGPGRRPIGRS